MGTLEVRRGADRARSRTEWLDSRHSLAFGSHYDPENTCFGVLLAHNEDLLQPGPGYPAHVHRDVEILTWVLAGSLRHHDDAGGTTLVAAGQLHHVSAGSGIRHTESSACENRPVRLVQMWLSPDELGLAPRHRLLQVGDRLDSAELVQIASGQARPEDQSVVRIRQRAAQLSVARLPAGATVTLPAAPYVHVFLASGSATLQARNGAAAGQQALVAGDALRITDGGHELISADQPAELLVWQMHARR